jgi:hypothetical protein
MLNDEKPQTKPNGGYVCATGSDGDVFDMFTKDGLSRTQYDLWPHPTQEFSDWIAKDCKK